jgi:hypothetical protein
MSNEEYINQLHPSVKPKAHCFLDKAQASGFNLRITSGYRTFAEQDALYAQGRTTPGKIVTNAKGGQSFHNFGLAFDVVDANHGYNIDWGHLEGIGTSCGLEHGDRGFIDLPHFQYRGGLTLAQVQAGQRPAVMDNSTMYKEFATDRDYFNDKYTDIVFTFKSAPPTPADLDYAYNQWKTTGEQMYTVAQKQYANELDCVFHGCPVCPPCPDTTDLMNQNASLQQDIKDLEATLKDCQSNGATGLTGWQLVALGLKKILTSKI